jgi:hypothetical protein
MIDADPFDDEYFDDLYEEEDEDGWIAGQACANVRLVSPTGMISETKLTGLTEAQGMKINILTARLAAGLPVEVSYDNEKY